MRSKFLFLFTAFLPLVCFAQTTGENATVKPEESPWLNFDSGPLLQKGSNTFNLNKTTGVGGVSIPIYQYAIEGVDLGISLEYSTQGIQVDRISSNVGLGWNLYTGGYIVRNLEDIWDETLAQGTSSSASWSQAGYWSNSLTTSTVKDVAPDFFYASFGGKQIKFLFSKSGNLLTIPQNNNIKIDRYIGTKLVNGQTDNTTNGDLVFVITDEVGNKFQFIKGHYSPLNAILTTPPLTFPYLPMYRIDRWVLSKVTTYEGKVINYTYELSDSLKEVYSHSQNTAETPGSVTVNEKDLESTAMYTERLLRIDYPNNTSVKFSYDKSKQRCDLPSDYRLNKITVTETNISPGKTPNQYSYSLNQSYFYSPNYLTAYNPSDYIGGSKNAEVPITTGCTIVGDDVAYRLKLNSIDLTGFDGSSTEKYYSFDYNPSPLPERVVGGKDIFGFANGSVPTPYGSAYLSVPTHVDPSTGSTIGMNRAIATNTNFTAGCSLTAFTNAQGGKTTFNYITNPVGVGGLLIGSVTEYDGYNHDNDVITSYSYSDGEEFVSEGTIKYVYDVASHGYYETIWLNSGSVLNELINGPRYGFKTVTEAVNDKGGNLVKKNIYKFTGLNPTGYSSNLLSNGNAFGQPPYADKQYLADWGIGLLLREENYDKNGRLHKSVDYKYTVTSTKYSGSDWDGLDLLITNDGGGGTTETYSHFTGNALLNEKINSLYYDDTHFLQSDDKYDYYSDNTLSHHYSQNSAGQPLDQWYFYNTNWIGSGSPDPGLAIDKLNTDNVHRLVLVANFKQIGPSDFYDKYVEDITTCGFSEISSGSSIIRPKYVYSFNKNINTLIPFGGPPGTTSGWFTLSNINMLDISNGSAPLYSGQPFLRKVATTTKFDDLGFAIEGTDVSGSHHYANIVENQIGKVLAEDSNAQNSEIAYCGFESQYYTGSSYDYKKGNWGFNNNNISADHSFIGRYSFLCSSASGNTLWTTTSLTVGKQYTVSFWVYGSGSLFVNDGINKIPNSTNPSSLSAIATYNGWTLYKTTFVAQAANIGIWGEGYVDELRLYPANSIMTTHNYLPLIGKTADVNGNDVVTYYEYDAFGNPAVIKDQYGNVVQKTITINQNAD